MKLPSSNSFRGPLLFAAKLIALGGLLVVVAALSAYLTVRQALSGRDVEVPDLTELSLNEASALLRERGLFLEEAARRYDDRVQEDRVLAQDPPAGTSIKLERKVKVVVSLGDKVTSIPDLRGGPARKAQITLQQQGMRVAEQIYAYSRREGENLVIAQDPLPGIAGTGQGRVALLVSRGTRPRTYVMPDLTGHTEQAAMTFLRRAGLRPGPVRQTTSSRGRPGTVVAQRPRSGYPVRTGDLVILTVARGEGPDE